jgi:hypothetical protein
MSEISGRTFLSACLSGDAFLTDIDDWVQAWHEGSAGQEVEDLDEFLGFDDEEGAIWAERPESLRFIVAAHRRHVPLVHVMSEQEDWALAARAGDEKDAKAVVAWLRQTGRL